MFGTFALRDGGVGFEELAVGLFLHITIVVLDQQIDIKLIPCLTNLASGILRILRQLVHL